MAIGSCRRTYFFAEDRASKKSEGSSKSEIFPFGQLPQGTRTRVSSGRTRTLEWVRSRKKSVEKLEKESEKGKKDGRGRSVENGDWRVAATNPPKRPQGGLGVGRKSGGGGG